MAKKIEPIDIREPVREICQRLGLDETYVGHIDLVPGEVRINLYKGKDGRCKGSKYVDLDTGYVAIEELVFPVLS